MKGYDIPLMISLAMLQMVIGMFVMILYIFAAITYDNKSMEAWWPIFGFIICMFVLYIGVIFLTPSEGRGHILGRYLYFAGLFVLLSLVSFDMVWWLFVNASSVVTWALFATIVGLMG